ELASGETQQRRSVGYRIFAAANTFPQTGPPSRSRLKFSHNDVRRGANDDAARQDYSIRKVAKVKSQQLNAGRKMKVRQARTKARGKTSSRLKKYMSVSYPGEAPANWSSGAAKLGSESSSMGCSRYLEHSGECSKLQSQVSVEASPQLRDLVLARRA